MSDQSVPDLLGDDGRAAIMVTRIRQAQQRKYDLRLQMAGNGHDLTSTHPEGGTYQEQLDMCDKAVELVVAEDPETFKRIEAASDTAT